MKQQEIVEDCEKFKIDNIDDHIYGKYIKNVTLTALEHLFKAFKLYTTDFRLVRLNQLKEVQYHKVNSQASDKLTGEKIEDILCGHYKMKKIPTIYKEIIEENKIGWKILTDDEKYRFGKHLNMMVAEGVVERYGNDIRFQEQKALNVWLSNPDARNYQSIKPDLVELEKNFKNDLKQMLYSENEDDRTSARKLQRREMKERFRISSKP